METVPISEIIPFVVDVLYLSHREPENGIPTPVMTSGHVNESDTSCPADIWSEFLALPLPTTNGLLKVAGADWFEEQPVPVTVIRLSGIPIVAFSRLFVVNTAFLQM